MAYSKMLLPNKHLKIYESLIFLSGLIVKNLEKPKTIEDIWGIIDKMNNQKVRKYDTIYSFEKVVKAIDVLYCLDLITLKEDGFLEKCD